MAGLFWIGLCIRCRRQHRTTAKLDKVTPPALPNTRPPFHKRHRLLTSKQAVNSRVNSRKFPFFMPFFKIRYHFKRSLSEVGLHKQITCEREKTTSRVKPHTENLTSEHFLKEAVRHSAQQTAPYRYYISKNLSTAQRHSGPRQKHN